jgi:hypothetical protein
MTQRHSAPRSRGGLIRYVTYESEQKNRNGGTSTRRRTKRFSLPAESKDVRIDGPRSVTKRTGRRVNGLQVRYKYRLAGGTRRRGKTMTRIPERWADRMKVLELPKSARNVKMTDRAPSRGRMAA